MTVKKIFLKTTKWSAIGIAICLLLSGLTFGLAQTEKGKEIIAGRLEKALNHGGETGVEIGKIEGLIPFDMRLDHLAWGDAGSQWLKMDGIQLRLHPDAGGGGALRISPPTNGL